MMEFKTAQRKRAKLRLAIAGPSGSGKTYSALVIASGITSWSKIAVIDSENGSAELYAHLGAYSVLTLAPPYDPQKYIDAIHLAEQAGFDVLIIDSLSHAWSGEGGILDQQGKATDTKYKGNSWAAWRECTPKHNALVETILKSSCHVLATMRSKTEYAQMTDNGKTTIKKLGMAPIQREGMEYEFTVFLDLSVDHVATASKDRTGLFDGQYFKPVVATGQTLLQWLNVSTTSTSSTTVQEVMPLGVPATEESPDLYRIMKAETKTKSNGQVFAKVVLLSKNDRIVAWSAEADIVDIPTGTTIQATLSQKNSTYFIDSYSVVKGGTAA